MDLVAEGHLTEAVTLRNVLQQITASSSADTSFLRISSLQKDLSGYIVIADSRFVTACSIVDEVETGYSALKKLLLVTAGKYVLLSAASHDTLGMEQTLNIELQKLIELLPHLPDSPEYLFDEKSLLDKVFADATPSEVSEPESYPSANIQESSSVTAASSEPTWDLLQPLLSGKALIPACEPAIRQILSSFAPEHETSTTIPPYRSSTCSFKLSKSYLPFRPPSSLKVILLVSTALVVQILVIAFWKPLTYKWHLHTFSSHKYSKYSRNANRHRLTLRKNSSKIQR